MKISLIIPTRNRAPHLKSLITNIEEQSEIPDEVVIIGHYSDKETKKTIINLKTNLNIKYFETDGGSCKGRNLGIEKARGDILLFIDDDNILEKNYIKNNLKIFQNESIDIVTGYVFDRFDLTTPGLIRKSEIEHIIKNRDDIFFKRIIDNMDPSFKSISNNKLQIYFVMRLVRNLLKTSILQEFPNKGKILPSGYRSEMPDILKSDIPTDSIKVEYILGASFGARKVVFDEFKFNEDMEILPYVLCEDLELSARLNSKYEIYYNRNLKVFHLRVPTGTKINTREKFFSMVVNYHIISEIKGNNLAYSWSVIGLALSRIIMLPFALTDSVSEIKGIVDGIKYLNSGKTVIPDHKNGNAK